MNSLDFPFTLMIQQAKDQFFKDPMPYLIISFLGQALFFVLPFMNPSEALPYLVLFILQMAFLSLFINPLMIIFSYYRIEDESFSLTNARKAYLKNFKSFLKVYSIYSLNIIAPLTLGSLFFLVYFLFPSTFVLIIALFLFLICSACSFKIFMEYYFILQTALTQSDRPTYILEESKNFFLMLSSSGKKTLVLILLCSMGFMMLLSTLFDVTSSNYFSPVFWSGLLINFIIQAVCSAFFVIFWAQTYRYIELHRSSKVS